MNGSQQLLLEVGLCLGAWREERLQWLAAGEVEGRGCGKFELHASGPPQQCLLNGEPLDFQYSQAAGRLTVQLPKAKSMQWSLQVAFHV